jgi:uncharacterized protein YyaL (SSP411 family)
MEGTLVRPGLATDYANMIRAALDIFALDGDSAYLERARAWFLAADEHHFDAESGAYDLAANDASRLIAPTPSNSDEATPAATGMMAANAATLFMLTADDRYRQRAEQILARLPARASQDVVGSASLQSGYDTVLRGRTAFIVGAADQAAPLLDAALTEPDPALIIASSSPDPFSPGHPASGKRPAKSGAALFLCDALRCLPEIGTPAQAAETLRRTRRGLA